MSVIRKVGRGSRRVVAGAACPAVEGGKILMTRHFLERVAERWQVPEEQAIEMAKTFLYKARPVSIILQETPSGRRFLNFSQENGLSYVGIGEWVVTYRVRNGQAYTCTTYRPMQVVYKDKI